MSRRLTPLPCPECRVRAARRGRKSGVLSLRVGNLRAECVTCNNFARAVRRIATSRLVDAHREEYMALRLAVEADLYPQVIAAFNERMNPPPPRSLVEWPPLT
jgi:hypothetical protein